MKIKKHSFWDGSVISIYFYFMFCFHCLTLIFALSIYPVTFFIICLSFCIILLFASYLLIPVVCFQYHLSISLSMICIIVVLWFPFGIYPALYVLHHFRFLYLFVGYGFDSRVCFYILLRLLFYSIVFLIVDNVFACLLLLIVVYLFFVALFIPTSENHRKWLKTNENMILIKHKTKLNKMKKH